ncbi:MAG: GerMN domain-containing protein [Bacteroidetes bacterium]|nr:GerMN domain-containing protein [Bacteroidota bacterium]
MQKHDSKEARQGIPLLMWVLLIVVIAGSFLYSLPKIIRNYQESGLADTVSEYRSRESSAEAGETESAQIYFIMQDVTTREFICDAVATEISSPVNLNSLLEVLIAGPGLSALSKGYISFIPETTQLLGSRIVNHAAYIDLSEDFDTDSNNNPQAAELAVRQIINTALSYELVEDVIILIDGELYVSSRNITN